jgi:predicted anti-sigma-YlaC factor YlaD
MKFMPRWMMGLMAKMMGMPSCQEVSETLSDYIDQTMVEADRKKLEKHLSMCQMCLVYMDQFKQVYQLTGKADPVELPDDFHQVMGKLIQNWKAERSA